MHLISDPGCHQLHYVYKLVVVTNAREGKIEIYKDKNWTILVRHKCIFLIQLNHPDLKFDQIWEVDL